MVSSELSDILDHTGMPAKDLSHHTLREDHPVTNPFYGVVYKTIIDILRGYLLLNVKQETNRLGTLADNVIKLIASEIEIDENLLIDFGIKTEEIDTAESRMLKVKVAEDVIGNLIKAEIENKTKNIRRVEEDNEQRKNYKSHYWKNIKKVQIFLLI